LSKFRKGVIFNTKVFADHRIIPTKMLKQFFKDGMNSQQRP